jgi:hypothetical protein
VPSGKIGGNPLFFAFKTARHVVIIAYAWDFPLEIGTDHK